MKGCWKEIAEGEDSVTLCFFFNYVGLRAEREQE